MGTASRWGTLLLATVALVTAGCTAGPSTRPAVVVNEGQVQAPPPATSSAPPIPVPPLDTPTRSTIPWTDCDETTVARLGAAVQALAPKCARVASVLDSPACPAEARCG
ncbi:hypothetical protein GCM10029964_026870 [Kibdelosporangium lantanae]